jgi:hypothetical protein
MTVDCPCCLESIDSDQDILVLSCFHKIHKKCIIEWSIHTDNGIEKCPMCRSPVNSNIRNAATSYSNCKNMALKMLNVSIDETLRYQFESIKSVIEFATLYKQTALIDKPQIGTYKFIQIEHIHQVFDYLIEKIKEYKYEWRKASDFL